MQLTQSDLLVLFEKAATDLGVPPANRARAGLQCFNSMVRMHAKHNKETDRDLRKCRLPVPVRPSPEIAVLEFLDALPVDLREASILNNVRPYAPLHMANIDMLPLTVEQTFARVKREIIDDVIAGHVPFPCKSFAELDGVRDANMYGGLGEDAVFDQLLAHFGGRDEHEGMPSGMCDYVEAVRSRTDQWLRSGGIANESPPPGWSRCDFDIDPLNPSGNKSFDSVFEKRIGGNGFPTCDLTVLSDGQVYGAAHGSVQMAERVLTVSAAATLAMMWALQNGWSNDALKRGAVAGREPPVPAVSECGSHAEHAKSEIRARALSEAPNLAKDGLWVGKILDVDLGIAIQKIDRGGNTVQHDMAKLSGVVSIGDVVEINYRDGLGEVSGLGKSRSLVR